MRAVLLTPLLVALALTTFCGAGCSSQASPAPSVANIPAVIEPRHLDFGAQWSQPEFRWTVPIHNTSHLPLKITNFASSCSCTEVQPTQLEIPPGGTSEIALLLNLQSAVVHSKPFGNFQAQLSAIGISDAGKCSLGWTVSGVVHRGSLSCNPAVALIQDSAQQSLVELRVNSTVPLQSLDVTARTGFDLIACQSATADHTGWDVLLETSGSSASDWMIAISAEPVRDSAQPNAVTLPDVPLRLQVPIQLASQQRTVIAGPPVVVFAPLQPGQKRTELIVLSCPESAAITPDYDGLESCFELVQRYRDTKTMVYALTLTMPENGNASEVYLETLEVGRAPYRIAIPIRYYQAPQ